MCAHRMLNDPRGLQCVRDDCDGGHVYVGETWPDKSDASEGMDD